ncbi:MAG: hypothetical protein RL308_3590 [Bacteroidota bacterium]|jgi:DNA-binding LytR/AlgR family response regulator
MPKVLIIEDQILIANFIESLLLQHNFKNVDIAYCFASAIEKAVTFDPDIVLMDINLEGNNEGIALAQNHFSNKGVIYLTAQNDDETISTAIATNPYSYLTKPIKPTDLITAVKLLTMKLRPKNLVLNEGNIEFVFNFDDIMYIKSSKNYIDVFTVSNTVSIRYGIAKIAEKLPEAMFVQIHRSIIVNVNFIQKKTKSFVLINTVKMPISRKFKI